MYLRHNCWLLHMQSINDKICNRVRKCGRELIFSANDFANIGETKSVRKNEGKAAVEKIVR